MKSIYRIIITLFLTSVVACSYTPPADTSVITTADNEDEDIGIGGTGKQLASESGIGGTGKQSVGILGTVTGFGSIFVNGIEIEYDDQTPFSIDGTTAPIQKLAIGDVVEVLTTDDNEHTHAKAINLRHEVIGKVESVEPQTFSFSVNGQSIIQPINKVKMPAIGTWVAVSGLRIDNQSILASRVTAASSEQALLRSSMELPFRAATSRWLIQVYAPDDSISIQLEDNLHVLQLANKQESKDKYRLAIKVVGLHRSDTGKLELDQVTDPATMPRGRQSILPENTPGKETIPGTGYEEFTGASTGANQGNLPAKYMPGANQPGALPGTMPGPSKSIDPGPVQNYRR